MFSICLGQRSRKKHKKYLINMTMSSLMGLSAGFMIYTSADTLAKVYHSWIHYVGIIIFAYLCYKYRLLPFTDEQGANNG